MVTRDADTDNGSSSGDDEQLAMVREIRHLASKLEVKPMSQGLLNDPTPSLLSREFGGDFKFTKTGNPIPASNAESKRASDNLMKAVKSLADPHRANVVRKSLVEKLGSVPKIGW